MASLIYTGLRRELRAAPRRWTVTGAAGFLGSHLVETLLELGQHVLGVDDFSTGSAANLSEVRAHVGEEAFRRFELVEGSLALPEVAALACADSTLVLHQAALGSVPRSIADPSVSFEANVVGFVRLLEAARAPSSSVERVVYASSSSVYGDDASLPRREPALGSPLSPYAATKRMDEIWASAAARALGLDVIGLRYFNLFGPRQSPRGPYAAVIPLWTDALVRGEAPRLFGDGETSRDFCPVANAVQANLLAAAHAGPGDGAAVNVALGGRVTLLELFEALRAGLVQRGVDCGGIELVREAFRAGDVRHSHADLRAARELLGYEPEVSFEEGLGRTLDWSLASNPARLA